MDKKFGLKSGIADSELTFKGFEYFPLTQFYFDRQYDMTWNGIHRRKKYNGSMALSF
jgi:hypothetical protein